MRNADVPNPTLSSRPLLNMSKYYHLVHAPYAYLEDRGHDYVFFYAWKGVHHIIHITLAPLNSLQKLALSLCVTLE